MNWKSAFALVFAVSALGYWISRPTSPSNHRVMALPTHLAMHHDNPCTLPSEEQAKKFEHAVAALEHPDEKSHLIEAAKLLTQYSLLLCPPPGTFERVSAALSRSPELFAGKLQKYQIDLAARLPSPSQAIVAAIGRAAFDNRPLNNEDLDPIDLRALARSTLASFGPKAEAYADQALAQMSDVNPLGTGAAQVAAATRPDEALPRISAFIQARLARVPLDGPIPWNLKNRLYELAYAISVAGPGRRGHVASIEAIMRRKVESWAPPFGMVQLHPKRLCRTLASVAGEDRAAAFDYCRHPKASFDQ